MIVVSDFLDDEEKHKIIRGKVKSRSLLKRWFDQRNPRGERHTAATRYRVPFEFIRDHRQLFGAINPNRQLVLSPHSKRLDRRRNSTVKLIRPFIIAVVTL
ncbi:hypothetical protein GJ496_000942 [Pomphorhynchus laevis]|nr:hypothetical protein GJ496_000942 [Pomphorhynchus laevis]